MRVNRIMFRCSKKHIKQTRNGTYLDISKLYLHSLFKLVSTKTHNILKIINYSCLFALLAKIEI